MDIFDIIRVTVVSEATEACSVQVDCQWLVSSHKNVNSYIKFLSSNQERVHDVSLNDIRLSLRAFRFPPEVIFPLRNLL